MMRPTITGSGFTSNVSVTLGGAPCTNVNVVSETEISCYAGPHSPGSVDVVVTQGSASATLPSGFQYKSYLYVSVAGSNSIKNFEISSLGGLSELGAMAVGNVPTEIIIPSLSPFLFVLNTGDFSITAFGLSTSGTLVTLSSGTSSVPVAGEFAVNAIGSLLYQADTQTGTNDVESYHFNDSTGELTLIDADGVGKGGTNARLTPLGDSVYVSLSDGTKSMSGFQTGSNGLLTTQPNSPYFDSIGTGDLAISNDGKFVYQVDTDFGLIRPYARDAASGDLVHQSTFSAGSISILLTVHPTQSCLYILDNVENSGFIANWDPSTGELTTLASSTFSTGSAPNAIAFDPGASFAFITNGSSGNVSSYSVGNDCKLTSLGSPTPVGTGPHGAATF